MTFNKEIKTLITVIVSFLIYLFLHPYFQIIKSSLDKFTHFGLLSYFLTYLIIGTPIFIGTFIIKKPNTNIFKYLGLFNSLIKAFGYALLFALPMFIGGFIFFKTNSEINLENIIAGSIVIGFIEELFFRGFLFGALFKETKLGFMPSIAFGAVIFATGHLYQNQDFYELIGIFIVTFMGAVLFAWLYVEWSFNLWIPIFLHSFMNLAWHLFDMDKTALGGTIPNIIRGSTIIFAIVFTVIYKRKNNLELSITKTKLFKKE